MESGIIAYRTEQGEYCRLLIYDSKIIETTFKLMEKTASSIINMKISNSREEIGVIDEALEGILKKTNMIPMSTQRREAYINSAFC